MLSDADGDRKRLVTPLPWFSIKSKAAGKKLFINICTQESIPEPLVIPDNELEKLCIAASSDPGRLGEYTLPIILCHPRVDIDKAEKECLVIDALVHPTVRHSAERIASFRNVMIAIVLDTIESQQDWQISREITLPKLRYKGVLNPREIEVNSTSSPTFRQTYSHDVYSVEIDVPQLTKQEYAEAHVDVDLGNIYFRCGSLYDLSLAVSTPDDRRIDIGQTRARWFVKQQKLVIQAPLL